MRPKHWLYTIPLRLRSLFRWAQADQELDDRNVDQPHFVEIKDEVPPVSRHAAPQLAHMLGVDPPADPEHDRDLESHRRKWASVAPA